MASKYWSDIVKRLDPYVPGEQPAVLNLVKLNTNENPYPPSPEVLAVFSAESLGQLRLYPDPNSTALKRAVAKSCGLQEQNIFVGNGSDEVLALAFMTFFQQSKPLLFPDITYSFYPVYCQLFGIEAQTIPLDAGFAINLKDFERPNGGIIFPNPNAPTGRGLGLQAIVGLLQANTESVVIVDEAYIDFGGESAAGLVSQYPNLLVIQTLSKSRSLAGLRVGFAMGSAELIEGLDRVKNSFNSYPVDRMAELAAVAAIEDQDYSVACNQRIIATREWVTSELQSHGFEVLPSQANFVFVRPLGIKAETLFNCLRQKNILVRFFNKPRIDEFLRITIGTEQQMKTLLVAIGEILAECKS